MPDARFAPESFDLAPLIEGLGPGFFRLNGRKYAGAILLSPWSLLPWGGAADSAGISALAGRIDVLFLGTGAEMTPVPRALRDLGESLGIGVEPMPSMAAARQYNLCLGEGRRVALAALPLPGPAAP